MLRSDPFLKPDYFPNLIRFEERSVQKSDEVYGGIIVDI